MNVSTIEIPKEEALSKLAEYRRLNRRQIQPEDAQLRQLYQKVSKGARVIDINEAFRSTGLNEFDQPKLAIARADWRTVFFRCGDSNGAGVFKDHTNWRRYVADIALPDGTFPFADTSRW